MHSLKYSLCLVCLLGAISQLCLAMPSASLRVKRQDDLLTLDASENDENDLNPINAEDGSSDDLERNKRKLPDATFEAKNALLGFVFGPTVKALKRKARSQSKGVKDDVPEFDRKNVSLDFPDQLFNKSFSTLTNVSQVFSRLIMNSARRYAKFMLFMKPVFGDALVIKGAEDPTTTTTTTTTTPKSKTNDNEI